MPKVFLVKRRSPGVSVRSWDELPDEERADTYIPGERRAGAGPGRGTPGVGAGVSGSPQLTAGAGLPTPCPLFRGGGRSLRRVKTERERLGNPRRPAPPSS